MEKNPPSLRSTERDEGKEAMAFALRMLARRDATAAELARRLSDKGIEASLVDETIARLRGTGYLDDRRFARQWAESAIRNGRGFGPRLRLDLARRGVPGDIVAEVLAGISEEYDEMETLAALLAKKFTDFAPGSATDREKRRVMQYLQRRGFSVAAIFQTFRMSQD